MFAPKRNEHPMHYWISFWPVAPLFGVEWRFEKMMPGASFFRPADIAAKMTRAGATEAARTVEEAATKAARGAEAAADAVEKTAREGVVVEMTPAAASNAAKGSIEPDAPAAEPIVEPAAGPTVAPATLYTAPPAARDDLKLIKGVGPKLEEMLNEMGIYTFAQIAEFTPENLAWVDDNLTTFKGRSLRDDWVAQAKGLMP